MPKQSLPPNGGKRHLCMHQRYCQGNYDSKSKSELRSVHAKGLGIRVDRCTRNAVDRSHGTNPVRPRGLHVHVAHGEWPVGSGAQLQLRRLKVRARLSDGSADDSSLWPRPLLRTRGPLVRLAGRALQPTCSHLSGRAVQRLRWLGRSSGIGAGGLPIWWCLPHPRGLRRQPILFSLLPPRGVPQHLHRR